ncbi:phosphoribosylaminoimidazolesuccinocarboxamide synthase [Sporosarcina saromensis]|uniref:Phosphoribosylaminoimidazole-succinocarboxamide synthase n=1 Tax=Sporosarcina saromensis TaxID=359365 RepID=A0ABU4GDA5_9BACL|nr:phosphoribosylaminoimidazolesuccinocarboxamide synthase [Sporosarcina saromensis]MDW0114280.1 phosphoribosylaminoimidazolesuccinocarboxamide synthase [Sporosarcina saromensis]
MELVYKGKTKDVYKLEDGNVLLTFKDDVTGEDGVFDPGANTVGLTIEGAGRSGLRMTKFFFEKLAEQQIPTHYIAADIERATMTVKPATVFGKGLEVICRFRAVGSFLRRYGAYCKEGQPLDAFVEVTIKDDDRNDPPITKEALAQLNILTEEEYAILEPMTKRISTVVKDELAAKGLELYDIKLEFGRDAEGNLMLIDEISGGNMRVYKDGTYISPLDLEKLVLS